MPATEPRTCAAEVSDEALAGWDAFVARHRINRNALGEVIGRYLAELGDDLPDVLRQWVEAADQLQRDRKSRRRRSD